MPVPVYVASPFGFSLPTRIFYSKTLLPLLSANGAEVLDPWAAPFTDLPDALALPYGQPRLDALAAATRRHGRYNQELLDRCAAVFAVLDGPDVDSGTAAEIGYAAAQRKPVVGWRSDLRETGETGSLVNLQVVHFVELAGGSTHEALGDAVAALVRLISS